VFAKIPEPLVATLYDRGWRFYTDVGPGGGARLMCSWDTTEEDVESFVRDISSVGTRFRASGAKRPDD
jgi:threonine aldolase